MFGDGICFQHHCRLLSPTTTMSQEKAQMTLTRLKSIGVGVVPSLRLRRLCLVLLPSLLNPRQLRNLHHQDPKPKRPSQHFCWITFLRRARIFHLGRLFLVQGGRGRRRPRLFCLSRQVGVGVRRSYRRKRRRMKRMRRACKSQFLCRCFRIRPTPHKSTTTTHSNSPSPSPTTPRKGSLQAPSPSPSPSSSSDEIYQAFVLQWGFAQGPGPANLNHPVGGVGEKLKKGGVVGRDEYGLLVW